MRAVPLLIAFVIPATPAVVSALERSAAGETDELEELLRAEGIDELVGEDTDWVLRGLLRDGFAQSPTPAQRVESTLSDTEVRDWRHRLARDLAVDRLRRPFANSEVAGVAYDIPMAKHPLVDMYVEHFTGRGRWFFERWLTRADRYIPMMQPILEAKGLPADTVYLAMVESGFSSQAYSRAAAAGFWQFIASTGRTYRLRQDTWVDERRDFVKATESAADYLTGLYSEFGDWHLAWAGYNAGGGRIRRALAKYGVDDYWTLLEHERSLAKETRHYVPKIIAAAIVAKNRERYGFAAVESMAPLEFDTVEVTGAVALRRVAQHLGTTVEELSTLNPALLYQITPPRRRWDLRVPKGKGPAVTKWLAEAPASQQTGFRQVLVRRGDTLWEIADRFDSTIAVIEEFNGIRDSRLLQIGQRLIVPTLAKLDKKGRRVSGASSEITKKITKKTKNVRSGGAKPARRPPVARHVVSTGDTLWSISQRYQVKVADLRQWNGRRDNTIGVGEVLEIF